MKTAKIVVEDIIKRFSLEVLAGEGGKSNHITVSDIKRPGIELAGFWKYFSPERVQILGRTEMTFLNELDSGVMETRIKKLIEYNPCCIIVTRNLPAPRFLIEEAEKESVPLLRTPVSTTRFSSQLTTFLEEILAPEEAISGVLVDIYGLGVLIKGKSGIGKSETAIQLVKRGHRLVADDIIKVKKIGESKLVGMAPEVSRYFLEMRGIGIINVKSLFGAGAVKDSSPINLVVNLEIWDDNKEYDRLGLDENYAEIMGIEIPELTIPVKPGRNLAMVLEVAAMNLRMKSIGYNAARDFIKKVDKNRPSS
ncbi:HPr(Ser) kinase/phosphatase [Halothermothrix orenii]|uniref:HPr kinase/phosphorylase n=1 Tax=Halothermothrix orenii (strain H 168 / OCM 544 / DSM 9562) TaxID=373903 RepID=B8CYI4_HALOH|nr:HPr(Ser) kinase/phosphatase [Halothermothrix orenii]ACL70353.1 HPr kinase [Halothermothrix orenii H 168]